MKNQSIINYILISILLLSIHNTFFSQNLSTIIETEKETNGFLIYFEPDVSQNTIDSIMNRYNSYEVWKTKYSKIRYWKIIDFPFSLNDSSLIYNIDDLYEIWVNDNAEEGNDDSCIGSLLYNYKLIKENPELTFDNTGENNPGFCEEFFTKTNGGANPILINILDTGFDFKNLGYSVDDMSINSGYDFVNDNELSQDDNGHGTHISSIISSLVDNSLISILETKTHNSQGLGKLSDIVRAIDYSIDSGVNIINASWSFYAKENIKETPLQIAIKTAGEHGILFVAAAGNDAIDNDDNTLKAYPASYTNDNILAVSSNSCDTTLSIFNVSSINLCSQYQIIMT